MWIGEGGAAWKEGSVGTRGTRRLRAKRGMNVRVGLFVLRMNFVTRCFLCPLQMEEQARQWLTESR